MSWRKRSLVQMPLWQFKTLHSAHMGYPKSSLIHTPHVEWKLGMLVAPVQTISTVTCSILTEKRKKPDTVSTLKKKDFKLVMGKTWHEVVLPRNEIKGQITEVLCCRTFVYQILANQGGLFWQPCSSSDTLPIFCQQINKNFPFPPKYFSTKRSKLSELFVLSWLWFSNF